MNSSLIYLVNHIVMKNIFYPKLKSTFDHFLYQNASRNTPQSGQNCQKSLIKTNSTPFIALKILHNVEHLMRR